MIVAYVLMSAQFVFVLVQPTSEFHKYYMPVEDTNNTSELSIAGRHSLLLHNLTPRCGFNNTNCQPGLSLAMWMKADMSRVNKHNSELTSAQGMLGISNQTIKCMVISPFTFLTLLKISLSLSRRFLSIVTIRLKKYFIFRAFRIPVLLQWLQLYHSTKSVKLDRFS